jgi:hypothetical protein
METYVIIIFIISIIISFVLEKNNKRFIIYSITALKKYFDKKLDIFNKRQAIQSINFKNINTKLKVLENESYNYATKDDLDNFALKDDLGNYISKKDFINFTFLNNKIDKSEKYKILSKIVDAIIKDSKNDKENETDELYDVYKPNWYK